ncbi:hypothetical protein J6590_090342 [Homalodisca vitripennis]|nr:hypothetical protein J6590_090342 [Homalodisca vitripennis]
MPRPPIPPRESWNRSIFQGNKNKPLSTTRKLARVIAQDVSNNTNRAGRPPSNCVVSANCVLAAVAINTFSSNLPLHVMENLGGSVAFKKIPTEEVNKASKARKEEHLVAIAIY